MINDIFAEIQAREKAFTKAERKVADFVMQSPSDAMYMSITDLAERCEVGDTSVFRFCRTLKLNGYQDFKMLLAQSLSGRNDAKGITLSDEISLTDTTDEVCRKLLKTDLAALTQTHDLIREDEIGKAVEMMGNARMIHFFGVGSSGIMALEAQNKFARILPNAVCTQDSHMQAMSSALMTEEDLAIAFSYSGSTKDVIDILRRVRENRAKSICITRYAESPLTSLADVVLLCGANEGPFQGGSLSARISQLYLLDILYTEFFKRHYKMCDANKKKTTESIAAKLL